MSIKMSDYTCFRDTTCDEHLHYLMVHLPTEVQAKLLRGHNIDSEIVDTINNDKAILDMVTRDLDTAQVWHYFYTLYAHSSSETKDKVQQYMKEYVGTSTVKHQFYMCSPDRQRELIKGLQNHVF